MGELMRDLRYTVRSLLRQPGFTAITVGTIALGIGATTAIFSVVQSVLFEPLPYEESDRLAVIWANLTNRNQPHFNISPLDLRDMQEQSTLFEDLAGVVTRAQTLTGGDGDPEVVDIALTTHNFLNVLGIVPLIGRGFVLEDSDPVSPDANPGEIPPSTVILSHELWQRRYGGDRQIVGRTIEIDSNTAMVVGVMPPQVRLHFGLAGLTPQVDVWMASQIDVDAWPARRTGLWVVVGRLNEGVSLAQAQSEMDGYSIRMRESSALMETAGWQLDVTLMLTELTAEVRPVLLPLFGAVVFVLFIACANVSNLFLVRASSREHEFAVRAALGGSRGRVIRQLMIDSGVIAFTGGALGLLLAVGGNKILQTLRPAHLPRMDSVGIDLTVLGFAAGASMLAALLFGLVPALQVSNPRLTDCLKDRGRSSSRSGQLRFRNGVVVLEIAMSMVLLIGAGLMVRSFVELQRVDPGFDATNVLTFRIGLPASEYPRAERRIFFDEFDAALAALPGVEQLSSSTRIPLQDNGVGGRYGPLEALTDESLYGQATYRMVRSGYFEAMRTQLVAGRSFSPEHFADSSAVVVVDELLAAIIAPAGDAVGKRMLIRATTPDPQEVEIIGVVEHQRGPSLAVDSKETVYFTHGYGGSSPRMTYVVRTGIDDPTSLLPQVRRALSVLDPRLPISDVRTMESRVAEAMTETRFALVLISAFGLVAMVLAGTGIYGVLSHIVKQRMGEIGVRMALGGQPSSVLRLILKQAVTLTVAGTTLGLIASLWATRLMQSLLVGVSPLEVPVYVTVALGFFAVAMLACWAPVRRATLVDPVIALRAE